MPPSPLPDFVIPTVFIAWAIASGTVKAVKDGRLTGYSIFTNFFMGAFIATAMLIRFFTPLHWRGISRLTLEGGSLALGLLCAALTKRLPAEPNTEKKWRKARERK